MLPTKRPLSACVARTGSISRAVAELHMSQPALSRSIRRLEDELGCGLLRRTANRSALTEAGCIAADYADDLLRTYRRMRDELSSLETRRRTLRIGTCAPAPLWRVTQLVVETTPGTIVASESLDDSICAADLWRTRSMPPSRSTRSCSPALSRSPS
ncbi:LysR family transcriptional regulator [Olsenella sp. DSM 107455]|uniref:LysR family transcriptional regulator n=1 Tax=Thermophilibacter gallinarum TaxID=2779357 RepID=A0ABR9QUQ2_9ACTN|nr:LysR family transcriptional regulator [Thermophilibacter gallinarum]MBE5024808.1 LysR family transcriptional regulator [Thermophilibacter gallinarum]